MWICIKAINYIVLLAFLKVCMAYIGTYKSHLVFHTAWIWIWITKRRGTTSDNGFIFKKIIKNKREKRKKKSCEPFWRAAITGHGQSSQSANFWKIAKMALFNPCIISKQAHRSFFFRFYIFIFIYFFKYETIVRSSAWSFGHSDPDLSSVKRNKLSLS